MAINNHVILVVLGIASALGGCRLFSENKVIASGTFEDLAIGSSKDTAKAWISRTYLDSGATVSFSGNATLCSLPDFSGCAEVLDSSKVWTLQIGSTKHLIGLYFSDDGRVQEIRSWIPSDFFPSDL